MRHFGSITVCAVILLSTASVHVDGRLRCFNCTYVENKLTEKEGGLEACQRKKFDGKVVPVITCDGNCVTRSVWGGVDVTQRTCHRQSDGPCRRIDRYDIGEEGYISQVCCSGSRCNNGANDDANCIQSSLTTLAVVEIIVITLFGVMPCEFNVDK